MKGTLRIRTRDGAEYVLTGASQTQAQSMIQRWHAGCVGVITLDTPAGQVPVDLRQATSVQFTS